MKSWLKWSFVSCAIALAALSAAAQVTPEKPGAPPDRTVSAAAATSSSSEQPKAAPYQWPDIGEPTYQGGGSVQPPVAIHTPNPKFTREARDAKFSGNVVIALIVDSNGKPRDVHVLRALGLYGLDDEALRAVEKYRFKPALRDGKPIAVYLNVEVNFIYGGPR